jgi:hypothetical protein
MHHDLLFVEEYDQAFAALIQGERTVGRFGRGRYPDGVVPGLCEKMSRDIKKAVGPFG